MQNKSVQSKKLARCRWCKIWVFACPCVAIRHTNHCFSTGAIARLRAFFGRGTGSILLDQVACTGTETRLVDCPSNPLGDHDCSHFEDAGVTCRQI